MISTSWLAFPSGEKYIPHEHEFDPRSPVFFHIIQKCKSDELLQITGNQLFLVYYKWLAAVQTRDIGINCTCVNLRLGSTKQIFSLSINPQKLPRFPKPCGQV